MPMDRDPMMETDVCHSDRSGIMTDRSCLHAFVEFEFERPWDEFFFEAK